MCNSDSGLFIWSELTQVLEYSTSVSLDHLTSTLTLLGTVQLCWHEFIWGLRGTHQSVLLQAAASPLLTYLMLFPELTDWFIHSLLIWEVFHVFFFFSETTQNLHVSVSEEEASLITVIVQFQVFPLTAKLVWKCLRICCCEKITIFSVFLSWCSLLADVQT